MDSGSGSSSGKVKQLTLCLGKKSKAQGGTLVGKIVTNKNLNIRTVLSMIKKGRQLDDEVEILELDRSQLIFMFRFETKDAYARILKGRPWSIQGFLLNVQVWNDLMVLKDVNFDVVPFWVQFHGLPVEAFDGANAVTLGDAIGETVMFEDPLVGGKMGRGFLRVHTLMRLDQPLPTGFWVPREQLDPAWVAIKYERLQVFCYKCGRIGHNGNDCRDTDLPRNDEDAKQEFGKWMCAALS